MRKFNLTLTVLVVVILAAALPALAQNWTSGYQRRDGTYVQPYRHTVPDATPYNNYGYPGNYNPNTGRITGGNAPTPPSIYDNPIVRRYYTPDVPQQLNPAFPRRWR
jgi:hypothetical protein